MKNKKVTKKRIIKGRDYNENKASDGARSAKHGGWRITGSNRRPTRKEIDAFYAGEKNGVYMENRIQRIDKKTRAKKGERFEEGGGVGSFKGKIVLIKDSMHSKLNGKKVKVLEEDINENGDTILALDIPHPEDENTKLWVNSDEVELVEKFAKGGKIDRTKSVKKTRVNRTKKFAKGGEVSKWIEIKSDFEDEDGTIFIDAYTSEDENESGKVIAKIKNGKVEYLDVDAKSDEYAQEVINDIINNNFKRGGVIKRTKKAIEQDKNIKALHAGKRESASGQTYWEGRENRSDKNRTTKLKDGGDVSHKNWLKGINEKRLAELKADRAKIEKEMPEDFKETTGGSGRNKAQILADFDEAILERENKEFANGGKINSFKVGDVVYNKEHNTIGIVRDIFDMNDLRTDADGVVYMSDLEIFDKKNPKHLAADIAPSTKKELGKKFPDGIVNKAVTYYVAWSSYFDTNKYDVEKITKALEEIGATDIHLENEEGMSNQPEVVVFQYKGDGTDYAPLKAVQKALDTDFIIIRVKDWKTKKMAQGGGIGTLSTSHFDPLEYLKAMGAEVKGDLNYSTEKNGINYFVGIKGHKALVVAFIEDDDKYMIDKEDAREMAETARTKGIESVELYTNYGIELKSTEKTNDVGFDKVFKVDVSKSDKDEYASGGKIVSEGGRIIGKTGSKYKAKLFKTEAIDRDKKALPEVVLYKDNEKELRNAVSVFLEETFVEAQLFEKRKGKYANFSTEIKFEKGGVINDGELVWNKAAKWIRVQLLEKIGYAKNISEDLSEKKWEDLGTELQSKFTEFVNKEEFKDGGHIGFDKLAKNVAKEYVGDKVKPEYQDEYGKTYDKEEAKEVGAKVAAKVYHEQQAKLEQGGEIKGELTLSEIENKLGKTFGFWSVPYSVEVDGNTYRKIPRTNIYKKL